MKDAWNERYAAAEYIYGTTPNMFLRTQLAALPTGRLLLPAEGEGRNAVHAAREGWQVDTVDAMGMTVRVLEEHDDVDLDEGAFHRGPASVVRLVAVR
jgi:hypothetical protein